MASSSSSSSSSVVPRRKWKYDVYVSFKGGDTRHIFVGHLYAALSLKGINVFMEDKIDSKELLEAIKESRWAVVVFSKDYANSTWCLEELSNIMENSKQIGQRVLPVFYRVDPSVIHGQKGELAKAFESHGHKFWGAEMEKVYKWRKALTAAASLSGQHILPDYGGEVALISNLAEELSADIRPDGASTKKNDLIGLEAWVNALYSSVLQTIKGEWTYDVFLNFCENDTGNNFTDHLYAALDQEIRVFRREQTISEVDVEKALLRSRLFVVVFSKNYAKSPLCLEELSKIMNRYDLMGVQKTVLPIFYHVDQSDIRAPEGDQLDKWRDALTAAANLRGIPIPPDNTKGESAYVKDIVQKVLDDLEISERKIGKLLVSKKEIGRGSNDTFVWEGFYETRPAAVKRIMKEYQDVAKKEMDILTASDDHPNIVRCYGVEENQDYFYIALERCICSLHELILLKMNQKTNPTDRLQQLTLEFKSFELQEPNGYPSPELLKLMRDTIAGLAHLHDLEIIHRDLKPQNVLIRKDNTSSISAKVSDMGISKRLPPNMTVLTSATGSGSSGWLAPETFGSDPQITRAVDLFGYGCLLFFCITGGRHPFGDVNKYLDCDINIKTDCNPKHLSLVKHIPEALDLVSNLIQREPESRPSAKEVYIHPLFWGPDTRLDFLGNASNRFYKNMEETDPNLPSKTEEIMIDTERLLNVLESRATYVFDGTWDKDLEKPLCENIFGSKKKDDQVSGNTSKTVVRGYKNDKVHDLVRAIKNKWSHRNKLPDKVKTVLPTSSSAEFDGYFSKKFPNLLIEVYKVLKEHCREEKDLKKYFDYTLFQKSKL